MVRLFEFEVDILQDLLAKTNEFSQDYDSALAQGSIGHDSEVNEPDASLHSTKYLWGNTGDRAASVRRMLDNPRIIDQEFNTNNPVEVVGEGVYVVLSTFPIGKGIDGEAYSKKYVIGHLARPDIRLLNMNASLAKTLIDDEGGLGDVFYKQENEFGVPDKVKKDPGTSYIVIKELSWGFPVYSLEHSLNKQLETFKEEKDQISSGELADRIQSGISEAKLKQAQILNEFFAESRIIRNPTMLNPIDYIMAPTDKARIKVRDHSPTNFIHFLRMYKSLEEHLSALGLLYVNL